MTAARLRTITYHCPGGDFNRIGIGLRRRRAKLHEAVQYGVNYSHLAGAFFAGHTPYTV